MREWLINCRGSLWQKRGTGYCNQRNGSQQVVWYDNKKAQLSLINSCDASSGPLSLSQNGKTNPQCSLKKEAMQTPQSSAVFGIKKMSITYPLHLHLTWNFYFLISVSSICQYQTFKCILVISANFTKQNVKLLISALSARGRLTIRQRRHVLQGPLLERARSWKGVKVFVFLFECITCGVSIYLSNSRYRCLQLQE